MSDMSRLLGRRDVAEREHVEAGESLVWGDGAASERAGGRERWVGDSGLGVG